MGSMDPMPTKMEELLGLFGFAISDHYQKHFLPTKNKKGILDFAEMELKDLLPYSSHNSVPSPVCLI